MKIEFKKATKEKAKLRLALTGPAGSGKAQPLDAKVLTPTGWVTMGSLAIGDRVVDPDGGVAIVTGIYPRGVMDVYRVTFSDGSSTRSTLDHLWLTQTSLDRDAARPGRVRTTEEIMASLRYRDVKRNHSIPLVQATDFGDGSPLPLDPYLMGLLLGNGCFQEKFVMFSTADGEIIAAVRERLPEGVEPRMGSTPKDYRLVRTAPSGGNPLLNTLRELELADHKSVEKFIPEPFKWTSAANRLSLLQGLMDTDGYTNGHTVEYSTSSEQLCKDVQWLVWSLGGVCTVLERMPTYTHNGEMRQGHKSYRVYVSMPGHLPPFRAQRKAERYIPRTKYQPTRFIESVAFESAEHVQCISVSSKRNLYVTDDFVVTHNTFSALRIGSALGEKIAVIDTEHGSASKYANLFAFDTLILESFSLQNYIDAIKAASGYDVIIIDSLSHAWSGKDGALETVDRAKQRYGGNSYVGWRDVSPLQNELMDTILRSPAHVIATMRSKMEYVLEEDKGKKVPRKVGMAPIQRDGVEYEFDAVGDLDISNNAVFDKTRCPDVKGKTFHQPGEELAQIFLNWLNDGAEPIHWTQDPQKVDAFIAKAAARGVSAETISAKLGDIAEFKGTPQEAWEIVSK